MKPQTKVIIATAVTVALILLAAVVAWEYRSDRPSPVSAVPATIGTPATTATVTGEVSATTTADAAAEWPDRETALAHLARFYTLKPEEEVRKIVPPFPIEREQYENVEFPYTHGGGSKITLGLYYSDGMLSGGFMGYGHADLRELLISGVRMSWFHFENLDRVQWDPGVSDWVFHTTLKYDEDPRPRLAALGKIISEETGKSVTFESRHVTRPCIILKGNTHLPDYKDAHGSHPVVVSLETKSEEELTAIKEDPVDTIKWSNFLDVAARKIDAPCFAENPDFIGQMFYITEDALLDHTKPDFRRDLQHVINNVQAQIGGTWTIEDRDIEVWSPVVK